MIISTMIIKCSHFISIPFLETFVSLKKAVSVLGYSDIPCFKIFRHYADLPFLRSSDWLKNSRYLISQHTCFAD